MDTLPLQRWLNQKGDNAATALATVLTGLGIDPAQVVAAIEAEQKAARVDEWATKIAAEKIDVAELATAVAAKEAAKAEVVEEK